MAAGVLLYKRLGHRSPTIKPVNCNYRYTKSKVVKPNRMLDSKQQEFSLKNKSHLQLTTTLIEESVCDMRLKHLLNLFGVFVGLLQ